MGSKDERADLNNLGREKSQGNPEVNPQWQWLRGKPRHFENSSIVINCSGCQF